MYRQSLTVVSDGTNLPNRSGVIAGGQELVEVGIGDWAAQGSRQGRASSLFNLYERLSLRCLNSPYRSGNDSLVTL